MECHESGHVSDATFDRAKSLFGTEGCLEMIAICGYYGLLAMVLNNKSGAETRQAALLAAQEKHFLDLEEKRCRALSSAKESLIKSTDHAVAR